MFHIVDVDVLNVLFVCSYLLGIGCSPTGCCLSHFVDLVFNYRYYIVRLLVYWLETLFFLLLHLIYCVLGVVFIGTMSLSL